MSDTYFIGYDAREHEAAAVCAYSILRRVSRRSRVYMLEHRALRRLGLFWREWEIAPTGQFYDKLDTKPFSTEFSHSRFLVFHLARELGCTGPCAFLDCDFLFLSDPSALMKVQGRSTSPLIHTVMRDRNVKDGVKMDGMQQVAYERKLWSAFFTFRPDDKLADHFTPDYVNRAMGRELHTFEGLPDDTFGAMPSSWHYIPSLDPAQDTPKAIHYSEWSPWINPDKVADYPDEFAFWHEERADLLKHAAKTHRFLMTDNLEADMQKKFKNGLTMP